MIKRRVMEELREHLGAKEITLLVGPRQAGKTTVVRALQAEIESRGRKTVWLNLDTENDAGYLKSQDMFLNYLSLSLGKSGGVVFIDEIQRLTDAGRFLKGIFDMGVPYKLIVTGSGSLELKEKISESLAGRKRMIEMTTVSFGELADFRTDYKYSQKLAKYFEISPDRGWLILEEYLRFGGYPRVVLAETIQEKRKQMAEIYSSYLEKDIKDLLNLEKDEALGNLLTILADQSGRPVNLTELTVTLGLSYLTLKKYLWYLEKTYIVRKVRPYFVNIRKEITKMPQYYFGDLGMANYFLNRMAEVEVRLQGGMGFQNLIANLLAEKYRGEAMVENYWRTKDGAEVDLILGFGVKRTPVEVKYSQLKKIEISRSMKSYILAYNPEEFWLVNLGLKSELKVNNTWVRAIPYWEML